jgi:hypothetical protein
MLIATSILAALLTALAVSLDAGIRGYAVNVAAAESQQKARNALARIVADLRTGTDHRPFEVDLSSDFSAGLSVESTGVRLNDSLDREVTYWFDIEDSTLVASGNWGESVLLRNVQSFVVNLIPQQSSDAKKSGTGFDQARMITLTLTTFGVKDDADTASSMRPSTTALSISVSPRSQQW